MWKHIDQTTGDRLEAICEKHFEGGKCDGCPLLKACDDPRRPEESTEAFTRRWELSMAAALKNIDK